LLEYSITHNNALANKLGWSGSLSAERPLEFAKLESAEAWEGRAEHARRRGALRNATECVARGLRIQRTAGLFRERGEIELAEKRFEAAVASFTSAIELDAKNAQYHIERAEANLALKAKNNFAADYEAAIELDPDNLELIRDYGWGLFNLGEFGRSRDMFEHLSQRESAKSGAPSAEALLGMAAALWEVSRNAEALDYFKKALAAAPEYRDTEKLSASRKTEAEMRTVEALSKAVTTGVPESPKKSPTPKLQVISGG